MNNSFEVVSKPKPNIIIRTEFICDFCKFLKNSHHYPCEKCYNRLFNLKK